MRVVLARQAREQLQAQLNWMRRESPSGAARVRGRVQAALRLLGEHPMAGRFDVASGARVFVVARTPIVIAYRIRDDRLEVSSIWHSSQNWPPPASG